MPQTLVVSCIVGEQHVCLALELERQAQCHSNSMPGSMPHRVSSSQQQCCHDFIPLHPCMPVQTFILMQPNPGQHELIAVPSSCFAQSSVALQLAS